MDRRQVVIDAATALYEQGEYSTIHSGKEGRLICRYRSETGCKCAIGLLIPDELYRPDMEQFNIHALLMGHFTSNPALHNHLQQKYGTISQEDSTFLLDVQRELHDERALNGLPIMNPAGALEHFADRF